MDFHSAFMLTLRAIECRKLLKVHTIIINILGSYPDKSRGDYVLWKAEL